MTAQKPKKRKAKQRLEFNDLTEDQKAYYAGFLDGDGSIMAQLIRKRDYKLGFQIRLSVAFIQKSSRHQDLVDIYDKVGLGQIRKRNDGISEFNVVGSQSVKLFLTALLPFLKIKQKQANLVLKIIEQLPSTKDNKENFLDVSLLVDQVANLNDSKNRTVTSETVAEHFKNIP